MTLHGVVSQDEWKKMFRMKIDAHPSLFYTRTLHRERKTECVCVRERERECVCVRERGRERESSYLNGSSDGNAPSDSEGHPVRDYHRGTSLI